MKARIYVVVVYTPRYIDRHLMGSNYKSLMHEAINYQSKYIK